MTGNLVIDPPKNRELFWVYALPYVLYVGLATVVPDAYAPTWTYVLRLLLVTPAVWWTLARVPSIRGSRTPMGSIGVGVGAGLLGAVVWVLLKAPFVTATAEPWNDTDWGLRLVASSTLVPIFEELLMRGYILGMLVQWSLARRLAAKRAMHEVLDSFSIYDLKPGVCTWTAAIGSSVLFALGHAPSEWLASIAYGLLMVGLWVWRRDLVGCITAHATTNLVLALYVRKADAWGIW